jgi:activator of HSP90 ATPase
MLPRYKVAWKSFGRIAMIDGGNQDSKLRGAKLQAVKLHLVTRREMIVGSMLSIGGLTMGALGARGDATPEIISHTAEAIHQELVFKASRQRVYEVLTNTKEFSRMVQLSEAVQSGMAHKGTATSVSNEEGGAFIGFGGFILGRQVELVPNQRIVQAWRVSYWEPGTYSIARFVLVDQDSGTKLVFDHTGFPVGQAGHLVEGWKSNYWEPMEKILG